MATSLEKVYDVFYSLVHIDLERHPEMDVNTKDSLIRQYLESALYDYEENIGVRLTIDDNEGVIIDDIPRHHIGILGRLVYKSFLERELNISLKIANQFNKRSELNVLGLQSKIVALRESLSNVIADLNRRFTRETMKQVSKRQ